MMVRVTVRFGVIGVRGLGARVLVLWLGLLATVPVIVPVAAQATFPGHPLKLVGMDSLHDYQLTALARLAASELGWPQPAEVAIERAPAA